MFCAGDELVLDLSKGNDFIFVDNLVLHSISGINGDIVK